MSPGPSAQTAADTRHWRRSRRLALMLAAVWLAIILVPLWFAAELDFEIFGIPFVFWVCSQGALIAFVLLAWVYQRGAERLDREHRAGVVD